MAEVAGFQPDRASSQRNYVRAAGDVPKIDAAFRTRLENCRPSAQANADGYQLYANDQAVSIPGSLAGVTMGVTGLDNAAPIRPLLRQSGKVTATGAGPGLGATAPCSVYYGHKTVSGFPRHFGTTTFPAENCGYDAAQLRGAYGPASAATAPGRRSPMVELGLVPGMFQTLQDYAKVSGLPALSSGGGPAGLWKEPSGQNGVVPRTQGAGRRPA